MTGPLICGWLGYNPTLLHTLPPRRPWVRFINSMHTDAVATTNASTHTQRNKECLSLFLMLFEIKDSVHPLDWQSGVHPCIRSRGLKIRCGLGAFLSLCWLHVDRNTSSACKMAIFNNRNKNMHELKVSFIWRNTENLLQSYSEDTLIGKPVKYNEIQCNSSAINVTFTKIVMFSFDWNCQKGIN